MESRGTRAGRLRAIAEYNGQMHDGLNGRSPLEAMRHAVRIRHELPRWVDEDRRRALLHANRTAAVERWVAASAFPKTSQGQMFKLMRVRL